MTSFFAFDRCEGLELIEITCFLKFTADQVVVYLRTQVLFFSILGNDKNLSAEFL